MTTRPDEFNGPGRELRDGDHLDETVYCVTCGTVFVRANGRDCPTCSNAERLDELEDRVDDLEDDVETTAEHIVETHETIDDRLDDVDDRLDRLDRDLDIVDGGR